VTYDARFATAFSESVDPMKMTEDPCIVRSQCELPQHRTTLILPIDEGFAWQVARCRKLDAESWGMRHVEAILQIRHIYPAEWSHDGNKTRRLNLDGQVTGGEPEPFWGGSCW